MRTDWWWVAILAVLITACTSSEYKQQPPASGKPEMLTGAEPRYEPYSTKGNQNYSVAGKNYQIISEPQEYSQRGLASVYGERPLATTTANGELFDSNALAAAHPTLPLPSYVRVTNLNNGRRLVVRVNDRGPFVEGRIIELTQVAADRLNLHKQTPVQVDFIQVSPDGSLSGPGSVGVEFAKQNFALPSRPDIAAAAPPQQADAQYDPHGLPDEQEASQTAQSVEAPPTASNSPIAATAVGDGLMLQIGALSDETRAQQWQRTLSRQFSVPGRVSANNGLYRVQLGPFASREQAATLQQRLQAEEQLASFIVGQ